MGKPKISGQFLDDGKVRRHSFDRRLNPMSKEIFEKLLDILDEHYGEENVHLVIEVNPPDSSVVKTIDNEDDAKETLKTFKNLRR